MVQHADLDHSAVTGAGIPATIVDAKGDIIAGTAADTVGRLAVGANDTILMADSGQSTGLKWVAAGTPTDQDYDDVAAVGTADTFARGDHLHGMPAAGGGDGALLGLKVYGVEGVSGSSWSTNSATQADVDATNAAVTFTAPASGNVLIRITALMRQDTASKAGFLGIRESTTDVILNEQVVYNNTTYFCISRTFYVSGISGGSHTYKLAFAAEASSTFTIFYGNGNGPLTIEVWSAP